MNKLEIAAPPNHKGQKNKNLSFAHKLLRYPNPKAALEVVNEQAALVFDSEHSEHITLKREIDALDNQFADSSGVLHDLENTLNTTKRHIKCATELSDSELSYISPRDWKLKDKILFLLIAVMFPSAMVMGASNVYANLMSSGTPAFIENPWLAVSLSFIMPVAATAIKFVTQFIDSDLWRRRYSLMIYVMTFMLLLAWTVLFAMSYSGISGAMDTDVFAESSNTGNLLVWSQLAVEIFAASALFLAAEDIYLRYAPETNMVNPEHTEVEKALKIHRAQHKKLCALTNEKYARLNVLNAKRQAHINEKSVEFIDLQTRFNAANNANFGD